MTELGKMLIRLEEVTSTNEEAKKLIDQGCEEGTIVISDIQTEGRGRMDRTWESPKGGLWMSVVLKPGDGLVGDKYGVIPLMAGLAVTKAIQSLFESEDEIKLKWPNDVLINGKKVCGILSEVKEMEEEKWVVVGIGINVNNPVKSGYEFSNNSTSIKEETGQSLELKLLEDVVICELQPLYQMVKNNDTDNILEEWKQHSDTIGRMVKIKTQTTDIIGIAKDIDENGALVLEMEDGTEEGTVKTETTITAGDCVYLSG